MTEQADLESDVAFYERLVLEHPKQAAAHHNLAMALRKLNRPEEALRRSKIAFEFEVLFKSILDPKGSFNNYVANLKFEISTHFSYCSF